MKLFVTIEGLYVDDIVSWRPVYKQLTRLASEVPFERVVYYSDRGQRIYEYAGKGKIKVYY